MRKGQRLQKSTEPRRILEGWTALLDRLVTYCVFARKKWAGYDIQLIEQGAR